MPAVGSASCRKEVEDSDCWVEVEGCWLWRGTSYAGRLEECYAGGVLAVSR